MSLYTVFVVLSVAATVLSLPHPRLIASESIYNFPFVTRSQWNARPPTSAEALTTPVPYVVIHHTYQPGACSTTAACSQAMRGMQITHQLENGWADIGYNFAVGGDFKAYEGRGWGRVGAHVTGYNTNSIGIALIGDWRYITPPAQQLSVVQRLIATGVRMGVISPNYKLVGHGQLKSTECPGNALLKEISTWDRFAPVP